MVGLSGLLVLGFMQDVNVLGTGGATEEESSAGGFPDTPESAKQFLANLAPDDPRNSEAIVARLYESESVYMHEGACLSLGGRF